MGSHLIPRGIHLKFYVKMGSKDSDIEYESLHESLEKEIDNHLEKTIGQLIDETINANYTLPPQRNLSEHYKELKNKLDIGYNVRTVVYTNQGGVIVSSLQDKLKKYEKAIENNRLWIDMYHIEG